MKITVQVEKNLTGEPEDIEIINEYKFDTLPEALNFCDGVKEYLTSFLYLIIKPEQL